MTAELPPSLWPTVQRIATGEAWPPTTPDAADSLAREALRQGLLPLLFESHGLPAVVVAALERGLAWRRLHALRAGVLDEALADLGGILAGEPWLVLKGSDYRYRLYPRPWLRPMQDIDILVPLSHADAVCHRLRQAGYRQRFPGGAATRVASHHERVFVLGDVKVEVHHSFVQRPRHRVDYDAVWERSVPLETGAFRAARLSDVDAFAHQALSMAVDGFSVPMIRFVDLWLMVAQRPEIVAAAATRAKEWRAARALYGTLHQASRLIPEFGTDEREAMARGLLSPLVRLVLDRWVLPRDEERLRERDLGRGRRLWRKYWLIDNPWRRACFALHHGYAALAGWWIGRRSPGEAPEGGPSAGHPV